MKYVKLLYFIFVIMIKMFIQIQEKELIQMLKIVLDYMKKRMIMMKKVKLEVMNNLIVEVKIKIIINIYK